MKPVLDLSEIIVWGVFVLCSGGIALPFFIGRVVYVMAKKDTKN